MIACRNWILMHLRNLLDGSLILRLQTQFSGSKCMYKLVNDKFFWVQQLSQKGPWHKCCTVTKVHCTYLQNMVFISFCTLEFTPPILYSPRIVIPALENNENMFMSIYGDAFLVYVFKTSKCIYAKMYNHIF